MKYKLNKNAKIQFDEDSIKNLKTSSKSSISFRELTKNVVSGHCIKNIQFSEKAKCKNCKYISLCRYCPGKFYMATGNYKNPPEWFCNFGKLVYKNFIQGRTILRKNYLSEYELDMAFNIIKSNMIGLGFEVSEEDKRFWCKNIQDNLQLSNFYFYLVYLNGEIVGFIEFVNKNNSFIISEIQLSDKAKHTKIILEIIKYLLNCEELSKVNDIYFSILKNNKMSNKTFSHLGGEIIDENDKKFKYIISRDKVKSYMDKFEF